MTANEHRTPKKWHRGLSEAEALGEDAVTAAIVDDADFHNHVDKSLTKPRSRRDSAMTAARPMLAEADLSRSKAPQNKMKQYLLFEGKLARG